MVQTNVRHNPVKPRMKAAIKPERMDVPIDPQEGFLINVTRVLRRPEQVHGEPQDTLVVGADQLLEGILVTALDSANYGGFVHLSNSPCAHRAGRVLEHNPRVYRDPLVPTEDRRGSYNYVTLRTVSLQRRNALALRG